MDRTVPSWHVDAAARADRSPESAEHLAKLLAELEPLLARLHKIDLGESAIATAFDPTWEGLE